MNQAKPKKIRITKRITAQAYGQTAEFAPSFLPRILQNKFTLLYPEASSKKHAPYDVLTHPQIASRSRKTMRSRTNIDADPVMMSHRGMYLSAGQESK